MNKKLRLAMILMGLISFCFGSYLWIIGSMIEREFKDLKLGTVDLARIKSLAEYPFIQRDIVMYNADLASIYRSNQPEAVVENLQKILVESKNPKLRFQTCLLLGNIYSNMTDGQNVQLDVMAAIGMYVQALKIKPDDLSAKLALEKILNEAERYPSSKAKNEIKQAMPKGQDQVESSTPESRGDDI